MAKERKGTFGVLVPPFKREFGQKKCWTGKTEITWAKNIQKLLL